nr:glycosyltransferase [Nocardioides daedukensis]
MHVTEAMGGGVTSSVLAMVESTPDVDHHLYARPRSQHDTGADLATGFSSVHMMATNPVTAIRELRRLQRRLFPDVVHAHSSVGGLLVRTAGLDRTRIVYSPHCFAFERRDISALQRVLFTAVERALSPRTDLLVAVAPNELDLAAELGHHEIAYVPNRTTLDLHARAVHREPLRVVTVGRISHQKDWRYFLHLKRYVDQHVAPDLEWEWLGGGDPEGERELAAAGVRVTGWIDRDTLLDRLADAQAYVHTAAWEAAPISILEAAGLGVPLVLRSIPALDSLALPGRAADVDTMATRLVSLTNREAWLKAQGESYAVAERHSIERQGEHLRDAYARACGGELPRTSVTATSLSSVARTTADLVGGPDDVAVLRHTRPQKAGARP